MSLISKFCFIVGATLAECNFSSSYSVLYIIHLFSLVLQWLTLNQTSHSEDWIELEWCGIRQKMTIIYTVVAKGWERRAECFFLVEFQNWIANKKNNDRLSIRQSRWDLNGVPTDYEALHCTVLADKAMMFRLFSITDDLFEHQLLMPPLWFSTTCCG